MNADKDIAARGQELSDYLGRDFSPRPSLDDLRRLTEPLGSKTVPGLEGLYVQSGKIDGEQPGEILSGGVWLRATLVHSQTLGSTWRWKKIESAPASWESKGNAWPCWDGIHDGDPITFGHVEQLRKDGFLA